VNIRSACVVCKVWNYKQRRCLFTLLGHLDYIRTTTFHHVSAPTMLLNCGQCNKKLNRRQFLRHTEIHADV